MAATSMFGLGAWEMLIVMLFGIGGTGLPLGIPPMPEDPLLAKVAPEDCTFYLSWSGMAKPDPASKNHTDQLLAEGEVQKFITAIEKAIATGLAKDAGSVEQNKVLAAEMPKLIKALLTKPAAAFVGNVEMGASGPSIEGGLIVSTGDDTAALMTAIARLEKMAGDISEVEAAGQKWKQAPLPPDAPQILWGFKGKYFIVGVGKGSVEKIVERARGEAPKWLVAVKERNKVARLSSVTYINTKKLAAIPEQFGAPPQVAMAIKALGFANVMHIASVTGLDDKGCVTRSHIAIDGEAEGVFKLASGKPLIAEDLAPIPADATMAFAARFDPEQALRLVESVIGSVDPRGREQFAKEMESMRNDLGFDLSKDLFQAVGDTLRVYNAPSDGGLLITGLTAVFSVRDRDALLRTSDKLEALAKKKAEAAAEPNEFGRVSRHVTIKHFEHNGQKVYFVNFVGDDSPISPAWCVTEKELVISLFPSHVKNFLNRKGGSTNVAMVPEVAAALKSQNPPTMIAYQDTKELAKIAYPVVQVLANVLCGAVQREGAQIDMSAFPSAGAILPHIQPSITSLAKTKDGLEVTTHQTMPMAMGAWQALPVFFFGVRAVGVHGGPTQHFESFPADEAPFGGPGIGGDFGFVPGALGIGGAGAWWRAPRPAARSIIIEDLIRSAP